MEELAYFCYLHFKKGETENPFYVGIGKLDLSRKNNTSFIRRHYRAFSKHGRNPHWTNCFNKYGRDVKIIFYSNDRTEIQNKEIELIKFYGRADLKTGCLVNLTDGGEELPENFTNIGIKARSQEVFVYSESGQFLNKHLSARQCCKELNIRQASLNNVLKSGGDFYKGFYFTRICLGEKIFLRKKIKINYGKRKRKIEGFNENGEVIHQFDSLREASKYFNSHYNNIASRCKYQGTTFQGLFWRYID